MIGDIGDIGKGRSPRSQNPLRHTTPKRWLPEQDSNLNASVNSQGPQNLNALFGVAYRAIQQFSVPQLGCLGYRELALH